MSATSRAGRTAIVLVALACSVQLGGRPAHGAVLVAVASRPLRWGWARCAAASVGSSRR